MEKEKLYFENIDATMCMPLSIYIEDAKLEGLKSITLVEAIPDNVTTDYIWCTYHGDVVGRDDCKKSICSAYSSTSGRGVCVNRGKLYLHGERVTFKTNQ